MSGRYSSWIWLIAALIILGAISALSTEPPPLPPLEARSAQPDGGLAANLWLRRIGRSVGIAHAPDTRTFPHNATVLLLTPQPSLSRGQARQLLAWTRRGGRLVVATEGDSAFPLLGLMGLDVVPGVGAGVRVVQPLLSAPPTGRLAGDTATVLAGEPRGATVVAGGDGAVLLYRPLGRGAVWLLTARDLLDNAHLGRADNRRLLLNLVGSGRPVIFEEYQPAVPAGGSGGWLTDTVWGAALLFALAAVVLYRWLSGLRLGPARPAPEEQSRLTSEYVTSLAGLLQEARCRTDILGIYQQGLRRAVAERCGDLDRLGPDRRAEAERLLAPASNLSEEDLRTQVAAILAFEDRLRRERV